MTPQPRVDSPLNVQGIDLDRAVLDILQAIQELIDCAKECCVVHELTDVEREQFGLPARQGKILSPPWAK